MERPVFSISTSFYNRGKYVDLLYEMICEQTYPYWEWVVTDDFSTEDSAEQRLKEIAAQDSRVKYYTQSRKKEVFYNPNYGCSGNIVMQLDSDDKIYPRLLEIYAKNFSEDPELMGITCGHVMEMDGENFIAISSYELKEMHNIPFAQMARAWRNTIPHFDMEGKLKYYQNDTNIWRHIEARGKVLFLPRELYSYTYSSNSISRTKYNDEEWREIEVERLQIENRFPELNSKEKCTFDLKYLLIERLDWAFYNCNFNKLDFSNNILFFKTDIKTYEKQLLNELFYDHSIDYNVEKREKYDEIVMYLNEETYEYLKENFSLLKQKYPDAVFSFFNDGVEFELGNEQLEKLFVGWSWKSTGSFTWGRVTA